MKTHHRKNLRLSLIDAFFFSLMVGVGETYFPAFALKAGMSEVLAGFFAIVPMVIGSCIQLLTPKVVRRLPSIKTWVVGVVTFQAVTFVPLVYFSLYPTKNFFLLFMLTSLYWTTGFAVGPTWNFWMGYLVPETVSTQFFARRLRLSQMGILLGLMGGGMLLHWQREAQPQTTMFAILFCIAFLGRAASAWLLSQQDTKADWTFVGAKVSLRRTINNFISHKEYQRFFGFLFIFYITIFISSPFVAPYFLEKLKLDYRDYMLSLAGLFFGKIFVLPLSKPLIHRYGVKNIFFIGALGIAPLPALWSMSHELWFVVALQTVSGAFWALFEVSLSMIFFNQIRGHEKLPVLTLYNFFNSSAMVIGTLIGGWALGLQHEALQGYYWIFETGSALRVLVIFVFMFVMFRKAHFLSEPLEGVVQNRVSSFLGRVLKA